MFSPISCQMASRAKGEGALLEKDEIATSPAATSVARALAPSRSKRSPRQERQVSTITGKSGLSFTASKSFLARRRVIQSGTRLPGIPLGKRRARPAFSRNWAPKIPELSREERTSRSSLSPSARAWKARIRAAAGSKPSTLRHGEEDEVVVADLLHGEAAILLHRGREGEGERLVDGEAAEGRGGRAAPCRPASPPPTCSSRTSRRAKGSEGAPGPAAFCAATKREHAAAAPRRKAVVRGEKAAPPSSPRPSSSSSSPRARELISALRKRASPFQKGTMSGSGGAGTTTTASLPISAILQAWAPSVKTSPTLALPDELLVELADPRRSSPRPAC